MKKEKDTRLVNIYIKIHNKKNLTMDDLAYLAKYNPECFKKTCDNLIYNVPAAKSLVAPAAPSPEPVKKRELPAAVNHNPFEISAEEKAQNEEVIMRFLSNLQDMEVSEVNALQNVDVEQVKDLVGNLYMEMLFPHSGVPGYFEMYDAQEPNHTFNARV